VRADRFKFFLQMRDALANLAAVDLKLRLAGAAQPDARRPAARRSTPGLARQMRPLAGQARQAVLVLRQLDLERAFARAGVLREDFEDQRRAVDDLHLVAEPLLQLALVARRKLVVEDHHVGAGLGDPLDHFFELAGADKRRRVDLRHALHHTPDDGHAGGACQQASSSTESSTANSGRLPRTSAPTSSARLGVELVVSTSAGDSPFFERRAGLTGQKRVERLGGARRIRLGALALAARRVVERRQDAEIAFIGWKSPGAACVT